MPGGAAFRQLSVPRHRVAMKLARYLRHSKVTYSVAFIGQYNKGN